VSSSGQGSDGDSPSVDERPLCPSPRRGRWTAVATSVLAQPGKVFAVAFVIVFLNISAWSLATPLFASPDEPAQVIHAAALVRGQLIGTPIHGSSSAYTAVTVPALIADGNRYPSCFAFKISVPASCAEPLTTSTKEVVTTTYVGRYPPLYYALVGIPSLLTVSTTGIYLMRIVSAIICALFIALAVMCVTAWSRRPLLLVGVLLAVTPMTLFLGGVVNPSGPEICSAICVWTSGCVLVLERADAPPRGLVVVLMASTVALVLSRGLSPLWVLFIVLLLALLGGHRASLQLLRGRAMRVPIIVVIGSVVAAVVWIVLAHANDLTPVGAVVPAHVGTGSLALSILGDTGSWVQHMIGVFGWLDTPSPLATYLIWYAAVGFVALCALGCSAPRGAVALLVLTALVVLVPVILSFEQAHRLGIIWQGRYIMPMAVGIPILATALSDGVGALGQFRSRMAVVICITLGIGEFAAFFTAQRRYASGLPGPLFPESGTWSPPTGNGLMTLWSLVASALLVGSIALVVCRFGADDGSPQVR